MYIMRRIGRLTLPATVKFTLRLIGRCLEQSIARKYYTPATFLFLTPSTGLLHFDADAKKTTCTVISTNETRPDFPTCTRQILVISEN